MGSETDPIHKMDKLNILTNEQKFAIFRKRPKRVVHNQFQFINLITNVFKFRFHLVVIGNCLFVFILNFVDLLAHIDKFFHLTFYQRCALRYFFYQFDVARRKFLGMVGREYVGYIFYILQQLRLVVCGYSWIDTLKKITSEAVSDEQMAHAAERFPINTPLNKEEYYYRSIFAEHFPSESAARSVNQEASVACSTAIALEWDAAFKNMNDPSGRAVKGVHEQAY